MTMSSWSTPSKSCENVKNMGSKYTWTHTKILYVFVCVLFFYTDDLGSGPGFQGALELHSGHSQRAVSTLVTLLLPKPPSYMLNTRLHMTQTQQNYRP